MSKNKSLKQVDKPRKVNIYSHRAHIPCVYCPPIKIEESQITCGSVRQTWMLQIRPVPYDPSISKKFHLFEVVQNHTPWSDGISKYTETVTVPSEPFMKVVNEHWSEIVFIIDGFPKHKGCHPLTLTPVIFTVYAGWDPDPKWANAEFVAWVKAAIYKSYFMGEGSYQIA